MSRKISLRHPGPRQLPAANLPRTNWPPTNSNDGGQLVRGELPWFAADLHI